MKELAIVRYIKEHGLSKAINDFKLKSTIYDKKILLKYDQLESPMGFEEVQDCRGLILEKDTWKVMSLAFRKFFNTEEGHAAKIDWNTAKVLEKVDGSLIQLYWDWHKEKWCAGTTGTAEAEGEVNNKLGTTFSDLFWATLDKVSPTFRIDWLEKGVTYAFELTTPYNIVIKPHETSSVTLLGARKVSTLEEATYNELCEAAHALHVPVVKAFDMNVKDAGAIKRTFEGMSWSEEGYVVVDGNFNRVKIKNPAYVSAHHLKGKMGHHHILGIIKTNEIEEFIVTFKERESEIRHLECGYKTLTGKLNECWGELSLLRPKNITPKEKKNFAMNVFNIVENYDVKQFSGLFFGLNDGKINNVNEYLINYDDKKLYNLLIDNFKL